MISRLYFPLMNLGSSIDFERARELHFYVLSFDDFGTVSSNAELTVKPWI